MNGPRRQKLQQGGNPVRGRSMRGYYLTYSGFNPFTAMLSLENDLYLCEIETLKLFCFPFHIGMSKDFHLNA